MAYSIVRVNPTVSTSVYADGDVLFVNTEFGLPASHAKLVNGYVIDKDKQLQSEDVTFYFFQENEADLGTINATANITDANFLSNKFLGAVNILDQIESADLDNLDVHKMVTYGAIADGGSTAVPIDVMMQSSSRSSSNLYPVYVTAFIQVVNTAPNFTNADALELVLHFEY